MNIEKSLKRLVSLLIFLLNIDTIFIDKESNIMWEYGHNQMPETLQPFVNKIRMQLEEERTTADAMFCFIQMN